MQKQLASLVDIFHRIRWRDTTIVNILASTTDLLMKLEAVEW